MNQERATARQYDVIVIGAGISGINTAYHLQTQCPKLSYTILEGRQDLGGTWSLFKYPGIRSDSDLHTFGFSWEPWNQPNAIAEGDAIVAYLKDTAKKHHIDEKIQYKQFVDKLSFSSTDQEWTLNVTINGSEKVVYKSQFIVMGTGYYDYKEPLSATIPGLDNFKGQVIHPQFWPEDLDYRGKRIIIVGSGATAVTLLPNLAKGGAGSVTQVQRSPGFFLILPKNDKGDAFLTKWLPGFISKRIIRFKYLLGAVIIWNFCRMFPERARKVLRAGVRKELPEGIEMDPNFQPLYQPWDQRMCITPGGDYFKAYRDGTAQIKTAHIETVTSDGMILKDSGERLQADIIITATGLKMQVGGGADLYVDGKQIDVAEKFFWKGTMLQDIPNLWYVVGYANASWTLAADASAALLTRMLGALKSQGFKTVVPRLTEREQAQMDKDNVPLLPLKSTYVTSAMNKRVIPRAGKTGNWKPRSNYFVDMWGAKFGDISSGLEYR